MKPSPSVWTFGKSTRYSINKNRTLPGPGNYTINNFDKEKAPTWKMGTATRGNILSSSRAGNPGVGQYNLNTTLNTGPKYTLRPKTNEAYKIPYSPGPGNYNPNYNIEYKTAEKYSMRPKTSVNKSNNLGPGPGQYSIRNDKNDLKKPTYVFGKENRLNPDNSSSITNPGPGNYSIFNNDPTQSKAPKFTFSKDERCNNSAYNNRCKTPGPGQYNINDKALGTGCPKISMSFNRPTTSVYKSNNPGPGQYSINRNDMNSAPSYKIGTSTRDNFNKSNYNAPGPGNYNPNTSSNKTKYPSWKFGTQNKSDANPYLNNPGPGNYSVTKNIGSEAPKYSLTSKNYYKGGSSDKHNIPGPGQYNSNNTSQVLNKAPTWKIGSSSRDDAIKKKIRENTPGPGNYNINNANSSFNKDALGVKYSFGKSNRAQSAINNTPGPGKYNIPSTMFNVPNFIHGAWDKELKYI